MGLSEQKLEILVVALQAPDKVGNYGGNRARTVEALVNGGYLERIGNQYQVTDKGRPHAEREMEYRRELKLKSDAFQAELESSAHALRTAAKMVRRVKQREISGQADLDALAELVEALQADERIMSTLKISVGL